MGSGHIWVLRLLGVGHIWELDMSLLWALGGFGAGNGQVMIMSGWLMLATGSAGHWLRWVLVIGGTGF